ncbi:MAG: hypothetical protein M1831_000222 [Alyxoria varia]|nr:MAG: hypothetical protein M1831_000222 [Alyxoria varia]
MLWQQVAYLLAATTGLVSAADKPKKEGAKDAKTGYGPYPEPQGKKAAPFPQPYYKEFEEEYTAAGAKSDQRSPPVYPSPWMDGSGDWGDAYERAQKFVKDLTLIEKVNLTTGTGWQTEACVGQTGSVPRKGLRGFCLQDAPTGIRNTDYNSVFLSQNTIAATWDRRLVRQQGRNMGTEHREKGSDVQLGPAIGPLGRNPAGGRNWEGYSPDPYLSGQLVGETIKGIQSRGVMACTKHYIANEQEGFRQAQEAQGYGFEEQGHSVSNNIDDVTMHELYLWPFADAVRAGTTAIMCSYNQVNNSYACQNSYLTNHLLKKELGFQGIMLSDWGAQHAGVATAMAGMDMAMPGDTSFNSGAGYFGTNLTIAVLNGTVPEWKIDDMATRVIASWYYVGGDKGQVPVNFNSWSKSTYGPKHSISQERNGVINQHVDVRHEHGRAIRNAAAKAAVLLKNENKALPLGPAEKFTGVFGADAFPSIYGENGCSDRGCNNGTLAIGWGSGTANFPYLVAPFTAIQNEVLMYGRGMVSGIANNYAYDEVTQLASQISTAIVFVNANSGEGYIQVDENYGDRKNLTLWQNGEGLIKNVSASCNNTIVVIHSTGPVLLNNIHDNENVTAIIWAGLPGEQSGNSIADVLYGRVNPGGKLPFTLGASRQDYGTDVLYKPNNGKKAPQINFREGKFIDYFAFDRQNKTPIYEFGHGLSYTSFRYSNLLVKGEDAGEYKPNVGKTRKAPVLGKKGKASDYVYPKGFERIGLYIYPYLNSTNLKKSSNDTEYGMEASEFLPEGALDSTPQKKIPAGGAPGGNPSLYDTLFTVTADITNTGKVDGDEVVQLYVSLGGPDDHVRSLRGFDRLHIKAGQTKKFTAELTRKDLSNWDTNAQDWYISMYPKDVYVGRSSRKLPLKSVLPTVGTKGAVKKYDKKEKDAEKKKLAAEDKKSKDAEKKEKTDKKPAPKEGKEKTDKKPAPKPKEDKTDKKPAAKDDDKKTDKKPAAKDEKKTDKKPAPKEEKEETEEPETEISSSTGPDDDNVTAAEAKETNEKPADYQPGKAAAEKVEPPSYKRVKRSLV